MKKLFTLLLTLVATTALWAHDFEVDGIYYYYCYDENSNQISGEVEVTYRGSYDSEYDNEYSGSVTIPATVTYNGTTYSVTSIGYYAFLNCSGLTSITIPNSVTSIGERAFENTGIYNDGNNWENGGLYISNCLIEVERNQVATTYTIKDGTRVIAYNAFADCSGLTSITIPNTVTSIGNYAFSGCASLTSITIPNSVTSIEFMVFAGCSSLTSVTIGNSVTSIGDYAFRRCSSLTSITIPNSVTSIGQEAFCECSSLTSVTIGNSVTSIGHRAFYDCTGLTSITIPNSVTEIGYRAFYGCSSLTMPVYNAHCFAYMPTSYEGAYTIPEGIKQIAGGAFFYCSGLTSITIPNSVISIGFDAFYHCKSLTSVTIPNSVTSIGGSAFADCSALTSITIPNSVTYIGEEVFVGCTSLTYLSIPSSVVFYYEETDEETGEKEWEYDNGFYSIFGCYNLKTLIVPADFFGYGDYYTDEEDYHEMKLEYFHLLPASLESLTINSGGLPRLGWELIESNRKTLQTIDLAATTSTTIPSEIFRNYYNLETLVLPSQLEKIPYLAVAECIKLKAITIPATVTEIEDRAFEDCRSIKSITFEGEGSSSAPAHRAAAEGSALWRIGSWAFYNCHQLEHLTIPEGVTEVGDAAFYGCSYLEDMTLPSTVQEIGDNTFALCAKVKMIHVKAMTPPAIKAKTFFDVNRRIPVYVPDEVVEAYKSDPYWSEFDIQGESNAPSTDLENTHSPSPMANRQKLLRNGQLIILRDGVEYNAQGQIIKE